MTYDSVFQNLSDVFDYFLTVFSMLLNKISEYPVVVTEIMVVVALPFVLVVIQLMFHFTDSTSDMTLSSIKLYKAIIDKRNKKNDIAEHLKRKEEAYQKSLTYFLNNPSKMSVRIDGFTFTQEGFEDRNWSNTKRTRVTKRYKIDENDELVKVGTSFTSTRTYDNTNESVQKSEFNLE